MKKRIEVSVVFAFLLIVLTLTNISAGVYFSQPEPYYNLGDVLEVQAEVDPILEGFLKVDLVCDGGIINVYRGVPDETRIVNIKFPLTFSYIQETSGSCYFLGEYFEQSQQSNTFEISNALDIKLTSDSFFANPNENITITGSAKRLNGAGIGGDVRITIPLLSLIQVGGELEEDVVEDIIEEESEESDAESEETVKEETVEETKEIIEVSDSGVGTFYGKVTEGQFSVTFNLKDDTPAGDYRIDIFAYEKDSMNRITSEGVTMANLKVFQVLTGIDVAINSQSVNPGTALEFQPILTDQSGNPMQDEVSVIITNQDQERIYQQILKSRETTNYNIPTNLSAGYYQILASSKELSLNKNFYVNELAIASFGIRNSSLVVTNIGNIPYQKDIQVELNGKPFVKSVDLKLGESQEFKLSGGGEFNIKVSDGATEVSQAGIVLTGHAVSVEQVKSGIVALNTPIVWILLIIILGAGILFIFRKVLKKKSFAYPIKDKIKEKLRFRKKKTADLTTAAQKTDSQKQDSTSEKKDIKVTPAKNTSSKIAEQVLVLKGHKNKVSVLAIKIKNELNKNSNQHLDKLLEKIPENKGAVYKKGEYIFGIFSPLITKTYKNEVFATKAAFEIKTTLNEYNKKFADKIELGIGINSGEIVDKIEEGKLKFTALGTIMPGAKRVAESSDGAVLLTKEAFQSAGVEIKTEKKGDAYEVRRVLNNEKNTEFIKGFLDRMKKEDKPKLNIPSPPAKKPETQPDKKEDKETKEEPKNPFASFF